jgi:arylsulfatase A-like enzyme
MNERKAHSVRMGRWKYVPTPYLDLEELHDLETDPEEQHNLLQKPSEDILERGRSLRAELDRWIVAADPLPSEFFARVRPSPGSDATARRDMWERLRQLGYISE